MTYTSPVPPNPDLEHVSDFEILREARLRGLVQQVTSSEQNTERHERYKHEPGFEESIKTHVFRQLADELQRNGGHFVRWETPSEKNAWTYRAVISLAK